MDLTIQLGEDEGQKLVEMFNFIYRDMSPWYVEHNYSGSHVTSDINSTSIPWFEACARLLYPSIYVSYIEKLMDGSYCLYPYDTELDDIVADDFLSVFKHPADTIDILFLDYSSLRGNINSTIFDSITRSVQEREISNAIRKRFMA